jgi:transposase
MLGVGTRALRAKEYSVNNTDETDMQTMDTAEFAKRVGVARATVQNWCSRISYGETRLLSRLQAQHGLVRVGKMVANRQWRITVKTD